MTPGDVVLALLAGGVGFGVGHAHRRMQEARENYEATKAALPKVRAQYSALWHFALSKWGVALVIALALAFSAAKNG